MRRIPQQLPSFRLLSNWASRRWQTSSAKSTAVAKANQDAPQEDSTSQLQGRINALPPGPSALEHVGQYHVLRPSLIPEAFQQLHNAFYTPKQGGRPQQQGEEGSGAEPKLPRKGGCKGLQLEMEVAGVFPLDPWSAGGDDNQGAATKEGHMASAEENLQGPAVMWRDCIRRLNDELLCAKDKLRILLEGPAGCGKSVGLATMVERCRAAKWLVLYVPSATALTSGGYFVPRAGGYDTIISAQHILLGMQQAHGSQLAGLPLQQQKSTNLLRQAGWTLNKSENLGEDGSSSSSSSSGSDDGYRNVGEQGAMESASHREEGSSEGALEARKAGQAHEAREVNAAGQVPEEGAKEAHEAGGAGQAHEAQEAGAAGQANEGGAREGHEAGGAEVHEGGGASGGNDSEAVAVTAAEAAEVAKTDAPSSVSSSSSSSSSKGGGTEGGTLLDLVTAGLSTDTNAALAVEACLSLILELDAVAERRAAKVLFAVDDYNALGRDAPTGYGTWEGADPESEGAGAAAQEGRLVRRQLKVGELTLAHALRLLGSRSKVHHASVLCAISRTAAPSLGFGQREKVVICRSSGTRRPQWKPFRQDEILRCLYHYYGQGALTKHPGIHLAKRVLALTNGNAAEIRRLLPDQSLLAGQKVFSVGYDKRPEPRPPSSLSSS